MTDEEYTAKGMLLGMEYTRMLIGGEVRNAFRERSGEGKFAGCAIFTYYDADTFAVIHEGRSELDQPLNRR